MRINVIGKSNGVGLSRDLELMAKALRCCGCEVKVTAIDSRESHRRRSRLVQFGVQWRLARRGRRRPSAGYDCDLNVMLEHVWTQHLESARFNIGVPNPEWFDRHDVRFLGRLDRVWAKTLNTQHIFERYGKKVAQIGFDSEDRYDPDIAREPFFFHLAGKSTMKGSARILTLWRAHPEWPKLVVVQHAEEESGAQVAANNIEICRNYLDDAALKRLQNRYRFHLCTSETEGWGHYLAEAMSVGAIVVSVDAPPMNELITPERGVLIAFRDTKPQKLAERYLFDEQAFNTAIERVIVMRSEEIAARGAAARSWFLKNKEGFSGRVAQALGELNA